MKAAREARLDAFVEAEQKARKREIQREKGTYSVTTVNQETGEITEAIAINTKTHHAEPNRYGDTNNTFQRAYRIMFTTANDLLLSGDININEFGILNACLANIAYETNIVCDSKGNRLSKREFAELLNLNRNTVRNILNSLASKGLIEFVTIGEVKVGKTQYIRVSLDVGFFGSAREYHKNIEGGLALREK